MAYHLILGKHENDAISVNARDSNWLQPLHEAAGAGNIKMIDYLIRKKAMVNPLQLQPDEDTGLFSCEEECDFELWIPKNYNYKTPTPLHMAVKNGHWVSLELWQMDV